jgi:hypothetical protein
MRPVQSLLILVVGFVLAGPSVAWTAAQSPVVGEWKGAFRHGGTSLTIVLHITEVTGSRCSATFDSRSQGVTGVAFDSCTFSNSGRLDLSVAVGVIGGRFVGQLSGDRITGTWTQTAQHWALELERSSVSLISSEDEDQIRAQLAAVAGQYNTWRASEPLIGGLDSSASTSFEIQVRTGAEYELVGVCDEDCSDLDLKVYDESGNLLAEDATPDDVPVIRFRLSSGSLIRIDVTMYKCAANSCAFGVQWFER